MNLFELFWKERKKKKKEAFASKERRKKNDNHLCHGFMKPFVPSLALLLVHLHHQLLLLLLLLLLLMLLLLLLLPLLLLLLLLPPAFVFIHPDQGIQKSENWNKVQQLALPGSGLCCYKDAAGLWLQIAPSSSSCQSTIVVHRVLGAWSIDWKHSPVLVASSKCFIIVLPRNLIYE